MCLNILHLLLVSSISAPMSMSLSSLVYGCDRRLAVPMVDRIHSRDGARPWEDIPAPHHQGAPTRRPIRRLALHVDGKSPHRQAWTPCGMGRAAKRVVELEARIGATSSADLRWMASLAREELLSYTLLSGGLSLHLSALIPCYRRRGASGTRPTLVDPLERKVEIAASQARARRCCGLRG